ncbi:unnamed protein product [Ectocarpus fasciculatus]
MCTHSDLFGIGSRASFRCTFPPSGVHVCLNVVSSRVRVFVRLWALEIWAPKSLVCPLVDVVSEVDSILGPWMSRGTWGAWIHKKGLFFLVVIPRVRVLSSFSNIFGAGVPYG